MKIPLTDWIEAIEESLNLSVLLIDIEEDDDGIYVTFRIISEDINDITIRIDREMLIFYSESFKKIIDAVYIQSIIKEIEKVSKSTKIDSIIRK